MELINIRNIKARKVCQQPELEEGQQDKIKLNVWKYTTSLSFLSQKTYLFNMVDETGFQFIIFVVNRGSTWTIQKSSR